MFKKINRKDCIANYPKFPQSNNFTEEFFFPTTIGRYIFAFPSKSIRTLSKSLSTGIVELIKALQIDGLIFLGDTETPWLYQENHYPPVKRAFQFLADKKAGKKFHGGFEIGLDELPRFLPHLFWLTRCNAAFPIVHFMDKKQSILGSICKYGNLHFYTLVDEKDQQLKDILIENSSIELLKNEDCVDQFPNGRTIKGRQTVL